MQRDFTYIDDVTEPIERQVDRPPRLTPDPATSSAPWHVYNIGTNRSVDVTGVVRPPQGDDGKAGDARAFANTGGAHRRPMPIALILKRRSAFGRPCRWKMPYATRGMVS
jgi:nucleoside-diphosphate-sugar epimerase